MEKQFEIIRNTRRFLLNFIGDLTIDQLNEIPLGFNNNIIWNIAHMIAAQQGICYLRGGLDLKIDQKMFQAYKPDTKPTGFVTSEEVKIIKQLLVSTIDQLETDCKNNAFTNYTSWINRYGVQHNNIDDTIYFLIFHDGLHIGYIMPLNRLVKRTEMISTI